MWEKPIGVVLEIAIGLLVLMALLFFWVAQIDRFTDFTMKNAYGDTQKSVSDLLVQAIEYQHREARSLDMHYKRNNASNISMNAPNENWHVNYVESFAEVRGSELMMTCLFKSISGDVELAREFLVTDQGIVPLSRSENWKGIQQTNDYRAYLYNQVPSSALGNINSENVVSEVDLDNKQIIADVILWKIVR